MMQTQNASAARPGPILPPDHAWYSFQHAMPAAKEKKTKKTPVICSQRMLAARKTEARTDRPPTVKPRSQRLRWACRWASCAATRAKISAFLEVEIGGTSPFYQAMA